MIVQFILGFVFLSVLAGCSTAPIKTTTDQLQNRVVDLERKLEDKDSEIVDLQYQVKDLSSKIEGTGDDVSSYGDEESDAVPSKEVVEESKPAQADGTIRVAVSVERVQTALKNAGYYTGKIDGKIGRGTKQAIKEFQKSNNLGADGIVGRKTWSVLKDY